MWQIKVIQTTKQKSWVPREPQKRRARDGTFGFLRPGRRRAHDDGRAGGGGEIGPIWSR
jgi:hypothetical protein